MLQRSAARDRRGRVAAPRQAAGQAYRDRDAQAEACLPPVREDRRRRGCRHHPGAGASAADRGRAADRAARRRRCRVEVRRPPAALSAIADPRALRREDRALDAVAVGRHGGRRAAAPAHPPRRPAEGITEVVLRRDALPCTRSGARQDQDRLHVGDRARRPAVGRRRSTGGRLHLRARPRGRACREAARRLQRRAAGGRLCRVQPARPADTRRRRRHACLLLEPSQAQVLRALCRRQPADRDRGAGAHQAALRHRGRDPRAPAAGAPRRRARRAQSRSPTR